MKRARPGGRHIFFHPVALVVFAIRVVAACYILYNPLWGYLLSVIFDWLDAIILIHIVGFSRMQYQSVDKVFDFVEAIPMLIVGLSYGIGLPLVILLGFRLIGNVVFYKKRDQQIFAFFPNFFEAVFVWVVLGAETGFTQNLSAHFYWLGLLGLFFLKELQEIGIHVVYRKYLKNQGLL